MAGTVWVLPVLVYVHALLAPSRAATGLCTNIGRMMTEKEVKTWGKPNTGASAQKHNCSGFMR
jgi:hypothetical protein